MHNLTAKHFGLFTLMMMYFLPDIAFSRPVSLKEVIAIARRQNDDVQIAKLEHKRGKTYVYDAESDFDLTFTADSNYTQDQDKPASSQSATLSKQGNIDFGFSKKMSSGTTLSLDFKNQYNSSDSTVSKKPNYWDPRLEINITQPILKNFFGKNDRKNLRSGDLKNMASQENAKDLMTVALSNVIKTYWALAAAEETLKTQQKGYQEAKRLYNANLKRRKLGTIDKTDLLASHANMLSRENDQIVAINQYQVIQADLKQMLKAKKDETFTTKDKLLFKEQRWPLKKTLLLALKNQNEYQSAKRDTEAKILDFQVAKNELLPDINMVGSFAANGLARDYDTALSDVSSMDFPTYAGGITISYPFGNHAAKSAMERARIDKLTANHTLSILKNKITHNVKQDIKTLNVLATTVKNLTQINALLLTKLQEEEKKFSSGRSNINFLIQFQLDYFDSQRALINATLDYRNKSIDLNRSIGIQI